MHMDYNSEELSKKESKAEEAQETGKLVLVERKLKYCVVPCQHSLLGIQNNDGGKDSITGTYCLGRSKCQIHKMQNDP